MTFSDVLEQIRALDIVDAAEMCGITVHDRGRLSYCLCPFPEHHDRSIGSVILNGTHGYCFACHEGFDAIKLVQITQNIEFRDAVLWLAERLGVEIDEEDAAPVAPPIIIPAETLQFCGIIDVNGLKKLYTSNRLEAFDYMYSMMLRARRAYALALASNPPSELRPILKERLKALRLFEQLIAKWRTSPPKPLRIK